ncbi:unnamed protein product [Amoebophrya sp. A25]|nr:unnamed protein product [Amoebophrya sp. A25]|eukprot:GSA25T00013353001.1
MEKNMNPHEQRAQAAAERLKSTKKLIGQASTTNAGLLWATRQGAVPALFLALGVSFLASQFVDAREIVCLALIFALAYLYAKAERLEVASKELEARVAAERKGRTSAERLLAETTEAKTNSGASNTKNNSSSSYQIRAIGFLQSPFRQRCGTPRQSGLCPSVRSELRLVSCLNAASCLDGLEAYSHLWVSYIFHKNTNLSKEQRALRNRCSGAGAETNKAKTGTKSGEADVVDEDDSQDSPNNPPLSLQEQVKAPDFQGLVTKILPPRGHKKVGIFACRTPHRPNPLGLSLAKIESIDHQAGVLTLSGLDVVDGTPVVDMKPYLPQTECHPEAVVPDWVRASYAVERFETHWRPKCEAFLAQHMGVTIAATTHATISQPTEEEASIAGIGDEASQKFPSSPAAAMSGGGGSGRESLSFHDSEEVARIKQCVEEILANDIRSKFQKKKHEESDFRGTLRFADYLFEYELSDHVNRVVRCSLLSDMQEAQE